MSYKLDALLVQDAWWAEAELRHLDQLLVLPCVTQRKDMITKHPFSLHLITDSAVIPICSCSSSRP